MDVSVGKQANCETF